MYEVQNEIYGSILQSSANTIFSIASMNHYVVNSTPADQSQNRAIIAKSRLKHRAKSISETSYRWRAPKFQ